MRRSGALTLSLSLAFLSACSAKRPVERSAPVPAVAPAPTPSPDELLSAAQRLRAEGEIAAARERLEAAHAVAPDHGDVRLELAELLVSDAGEAARAATLLEGVETRGARWHLAEAAVRELAGEDAAAAEAYGRALAERPDPEVRLRRALLLERTGRWADALEELERLRDERPGDAIAGHRRAALYESAGRMAAAEAELLALAEAQPDRPQGWERLARFYERTGRSDDARVALARAKDASGGGRVLRPLLPSKR